MSKRNQKYRSFRDFESGDLIIGKDTSYKRSVYQFIRRNLFDPEMAVLKIIFFDGVFINQSGIQVSDRPIREFRPIDFNEIDQKLWQYIDFRCSKKKDSKRSIVTCKKEFKV